MDAIIDAFTWLVDEGNKFIMDLYFDRPAAWTRGLFYCAHTFRAGTLAVKNAFCAFE